MTYQQEYQKEWHKKYPNYRSEYYQKNKEHIKVLVKERRKRHLDKILKYNRKYRQSNKAYFREYNKKWGQTLRKRLIKEMGGVCQNCGYSKCYWALDVHHLNPKDKEGNASSSKLTKVRIKVLIRKWKNGELRLLCSNCHRETHYIIEREKNK